MPLHQLDHVNLPTSRLDEMIAWYEEVLGMVNGKRPPFPFPGAWLYVGDNPVVHLVGTDTERQNIEPKIEHFALSATDLIDFKTRVESKNIEVDWIRVPGFGILQANIFDPDGNHIHIDFSAEEADAAGM